MKNKQKHQSRSLQNVETAMGQLKTVPPHSAQEAIKAKPSHDEVSRKAYEIYQAECCPQGRETQHWLQAEAQMLN